MSFKVMCDVLIYASDQTADAKVVLQGTTARETEALGKATGLPLLEGTTLVLTQDDADGVFTLLDAEGLITVPLA